MPFSVRPALWHWGGISHGGTKKGPESQGAWQVRLLGGKEKILQKGPVCGESKAGLAVQGRAPTEEPAHCSVHMYCGTYSPTEWETRDTCKNVGGCMC